MNIEQLREELKIDEGVKYEVYLDHLGLPTCGIGHLIKDTDPEHGLEVGTAISEERVNAIFEEDVKVTISECEDLFGNFNDLPEEAQLILANMMFNMGKPRLSKFVNLRKNIEEKDFPSSAIEMHASKWRRQVPNRARRLIERMKEVS